MDITDLYLLDSAKRTILKLLFQALSSLNENAQSDFFFITLTFLTLKTPRLNDRRINGL